jgi:hypothetical protein
MQMIGNHYIIYIIHNMLVLQTIFLTVIVCYKVCRLLFRATGLHQTQRIHCHGMAHQTHARRFLVTGVRLRVFGRCRPLPATQRLCKFLVFILYAITMMANTWHARNKKKTKIMRFCTRHVKKICHPCTITLYCIIINTFCVCTATIPSVLAGR